MVAAEVVGGDEQLVARELGGAVEVDRAGGLVGGERDHALHAAVDRCLDHVLRAEDVGLDRLERVVLAHRHLLERRGVDHHVDVLHRTVEAVAVAHVADEEPQLRVLVVRERLLHLELLELVSRVHDHSANARIAVEDGADELLAEGTGSSGDKDGLAVEHG